MSKKKAEKQIKRLKRRAMEAEAANEWLEKRVRKLKRKVDAQRRHISDLEERLTHGPQTSEAESSAIAEFGPRDGASIATRHRAAWKQHSFLRDRYEFHLDAGSTKDSARSLANEDLKREFGPDSGYTDDELSAILS